MRENNNTIIQLELDNIKEIFSGLTRHTVVDTNQILPFIASRDSPHIKGNFSQVFGDYVRNICGLSFKKSPKYDNNELHSLNEISELIIKEIEFSNSEEKSDFLRFIKSFLFKKGKINPIHPYLYNYMTSDPLYINEMKKYGKFLSDILIHPDNEIEDIFNKMETEDILTEIIISKIGSIELVNRKETIKNQNLIPFLSELYKKDVLYLKDYNNYFLTSFPILTQFYIFMYTCQVILKFDQYTSADFNQVDVFHFALDWESVSGRREAASGPGSFRDIQERSESLFPHVHVLSYLSHNTANVKKDDKYSFMTYSTIKEIASEQGVEVEQGLIKSINDWIISYSQLEWLHNEVKVDGENNSLESAFKELHSAFKQGMSEDARRRYGAHVTHLASKQFIKNRGSLRQVFNLTREFVLVLTAVSVKNERIPLNVLFVEYEKRGISLDWRSKKEVIRLLEDLNFIDKKSDSGDAQYVKPIL